MSALAARPVVQVGTGVGLGCKYRECTAVVTTETVYKTVGAEKRGLPPLRLLSWRGVWLRAGTLPAHTLYLSGHGWTAPSRSRQRVMGLSVVGMHVFWLRSSRLIRGCRASTVSRLRKRRGSTRVSTPAKPSRIARLAEPHRRGSTVTRRRHRVFHLAGEGLEELLHLRHLALAGRQLDLLFVDEPVRRARVGRS